MISKKSVLATAALSILLVLLWHWRSGVIAKREAEQALYLAYVGGPLSDYCLGLTRSLPRLHGERSADFADAEKSAAASVAELQTLLASAPETQTRTWLAKALLYHQSLQAQIGTWKTAKPSAWPALLLAEKDEREHLIYILETLRYKAFKEWKQTQAQFLEINALIYSLKELSTKSPQ